MNIENNKAPFKLALHIAVKTHIEHLKNEAHRMKASNDDSAGTWSATYTYEDYFVGYVAELIDEVFKEYTDAAKRKLAGDGRPEHNLLFRINHFYKAVNGLPEVIALYRTLLEKGDVTWHPTYLERAATFRELQELFTECSVSWPNDWKGFTPDEQNG